jgi:hypothetical protein
MRRRALLANGTALLTSVAGCAEGTFGSDLAGSGAELPTARLSMEQSDDTALARRLCYSIESGNDAERKRPRLLRQLADEGVAEDRRTRELLPAGRPICYDGTAYRLDYEITEETPATTFSVKLDIVTGKTPAGRTVQYADLPAVDRDVFRREGFADGISGIGTTLLYTREEVEGSALVPDSDIAIIEWANGERAEWHVDEGYETTLNTYRYTVESSRPTAELGRQLRERQTWTLSGLSEAEREVVETAVTEEGYVVPPDEELPDAVRSLADRFRPRRQAHGPEETPESDLNGPYLVRYDGQVYYTVFSVASSARSTETA